MVRFWPSMFYIIYFVFAACVDGTAPTASHRPTRRLPFDVFFVSQADHCDVAVKFLDYLTIPDNVASDDIKEKQGVAWRQRLLDAAQREARSRGDDTSASLLTHGSHSDLTVLKNKLLRRDLSIAYMSLVYYYQREASVQGHRETLQNYTSASLLHFPLTNTDIVDNTGLLKDQLFQVANKIPCWKYPPEKNQKRYVMPEPPTISTRRLSTDDETRQPRHSVFPDDPYLEPRPGITNGQWYLGGPHENTLDQTYGANVMGAWPIIRAHPDLQQNLCNATQEYAGYDYAMGHPNFYREPLDLIHGTITAGIIAATANNGYKTSGVCWGCKIKCNKIYDDVFGISVASVIAAIQDALLLPTSPIIFLCFTGFTPSYAEREILELAVVFLNALVIAPAGQHRCNLDVTHEESSQACHSTDGSRTLVYPAAYDVEGLIIVGASTQQGFRARSSNWGARRVTVFAPGDDLVVPYNTLQAPNGVVTAHGTAFAAALVAGVAGLVQSRRPTYGGAEIREILRKTVRRLDEFSNISAWGGLIDAEAAVREVSDGLMDPVVPKKYPPPDPDMTASHYVRFSSLAPTFSGLDNLHVVIVSLLSTFLFSA